MFYPIATVSGMKTSIKMRVDPTDGSPSRGSMYIERIV
jgi:hypothetical protein